MIKNFTITKVEIRQMNEEETKQVSPSDFEDELKGYKQRGFDLYQVFPLLKKPVYYGQGSWNTPSQDWDGNMDSLVYLHLYMTGDKENSRRADRGGVIRYAHPVVPKTQHRMDCKKENMFVFDDGNCLSKWVFSAHYVLECLKKFNPEWYDSAVNGKELPKPPKSKPILR